MRIFRRGNFWSGCWKPRREDLSKSIPCNAKSFGLLLEVSTIDATVTPDAQRYVHIRELFLSRQYRDIVIIIIIIVCRPLSMLRTGSTIPPSQATPTRSLNL